MPLRAADRGEDCPIVIGGGHCAFNPEPVAEFFDLFSIGEGEEARPELCRLSINMKKAGDYTKEKFLHAAAKLEGFYVPSLYSVDYNADGTIASFTPKYDDIPVKIRKRIVRDLDKAYYPTKTYMPYIETVSAAAASARRVWSAAPCVKRRSTSCLTMQNACMSIRVMTK